jgi:uncharacterized protein YoxC
MPTKLIYLNDELLAEAKLLNFSELVQKLFKDYLQTKKSKEELMTETDKLAEEKSKLLAEIEKKEGKIELAVKEVMSVEQQTKEAEERTAHKLADKISNCITNSKEMFGIDVTEKQAVDFLNSEYTNILKFLEANK